MAQFFAGLDVSDLTTAICVLDKTGAVIWEGSAETTPKALCFALKPYKKALHAVGFEAGPKAPWLQRGLAAQRFSVVCLETRYTHAALSAQRNKTDATDAKGLATLLCRGIYTTSYVKTTEALRTRMLLTTRKALQTKAHDLHLTLRMTLKHFGAALIRKTDRLSYAESTPRPDHELRSLAQPIIRAHAAVLAEFRGVDALVEAKTKADTVCRRLMTIPGIGPITALSFKAAIDDPERFASSRAVAAYFGLTPRRYQSGETDVMGGISKRGDRSVRAALYEASKSLVYKCRNQSRLRLWALDVVERRGSKIGLIATSRKLCVIMHRMWITGRDFDASPGAGAI